MKRFNSIPEAISHIKQGKVLIIVDEKRENEGDFFLPAQFANPEKVNFMITYGKGLICVPITKIRAQRLKLSYMVPPRDNTEITGVNFTISVNAARNITTGISAFDRAETIKLLVDEKFGPTDFTQPGHVFPLIAENGGILERLGHTEAAIDLCRLADLSPVGVLCEIVGKDGKMAKFSELQNLGQKFNLKIISINDLVTYLRSHPLSILKNSDVLKISESKLPTRYGQFMITVYRSQLGNNEHVALTAGKLDKQPILTRIHSQCLTGDTFSSLRCDCQLQLICSMKSINKNGSGVLIYLNQEGRGIGLANKIKAYALQEQNIDTVDANRALGFPDDARDYKIAAEILQDLGISNINLLTNNPGKIKGLKKYGIKITRRIPIEVKAQEHNSKYLSVKKAKLGHLLTDV